jgi:hypothetical protein
VHWVAWRGVFFLGGGEITISGLYEYWDIYPLCRIECMYMMACIGPGA